MNRSWFFSFLLSFVLSFISMIIFPDSNESSYWFVFRTSFLLSLLFLFGGLFILIRNFRYLLAYMIEIPLSMKSNYRGRFRFWLVIFFAWFIYLLSCFPFYVLPISTVLVIREIGIWRNKHQKTFTFQ